MEYIQKNWQEIVARYQRSNPKAAVIQILNSFLPFLLIWVLMYWSLSYSYWITLGLAVVNAFFLVRIFIIQHDCGHQSFLSSKKWNNAIGTFCSFFSLIPYKYWAKSHNFHHGHTGRLEEEVRDIGDIVFLTVDEYRALSTWGRFKYRVFRSPIALFVIGPIYYLFVVNRLPLIKLKNWDAAKRSLWLSNIFVALVFGLCLWLLGVKHFISVQLPILLFFGVIAVWFFYVQHQHEKTYKQWKERWSYELAALRGSTYYKLPKLVQWLTGNIGLHHIHHLSSLIPNYNLEKCKQENPELQEVVTNLTFTQSLSCIFNKLWDEQQERMISFREFYRREGKSLLSI